MNCVRRAEISLGLMSRRSTIIIIIINLFEIILLSRFSMDLYIISILKTNTERFCKCETYYYFSAWTFQTRWPRCECRGRLKTNALYYHYLLYHGVWRCYSCTRRDSGGRQGDEGKVARCVNGWSSPSACRSSRSFSFRTQSRKTKTGPLSTLRECCCLMFKKICM